MERYLNESDPYKEFLVKDTRDARKNYSASFQALNSCDPVKKSTRNTSAGKLLVYYRLIPTSEQDSDESVARPKTRQVDK